MTPFTPALRAAGWDWSAVNRAIALETSLLTAAAGDVAQQSGCAASEVLADFHGAREPVLNLLKAPKGWRDLAMMFGGTPPADWPTQH
ncbi:hypothetical protein ACFSC3_19295 [Sphingomonas floccifaciens]|uniref:Uncharacterized protein n=2 Tax=Sphingomonas floccifaciens TaxID=1844115 RepID=A0ABW4NHS7_9SPHN